MLWPADFGVGIGFSREHACALGLYTHYGLRVVHPFTPTFLGNTQGTARAGAIMPQESIELLAELLDARSQCKRDLPTTVSLENRPITCGSVADVAVRSEHFACWRPMNGYDGSLTRCTQHEDDIILLREDARGSSSSQTLPDRRAGQPITSTAG